MVHGVEGFAEVQEENSTGAACIDIGINMMQELNEARASRVSLPEPRLVGAQYTMGGQIFVDLVMDQSFKELA